MQGILLTCNKVCSDKIKLYTQNDIMDNEIMLGLRKLTGINRNDFEKKFGKKIEEAYPIHPFIKKIRYFIMIVVTMF